MKKTVCIDAQTESAANKTRKIYIIQSTLGTVIQIKINQNQRRKTSPFIIIVLSGHLKSERRKIQS